MSSPRDALYDRLIDVLGVDHANTMMRYLPDDQPATRQDLSETRSDLRAEIADVKTELRAEIADVRSELRDFRTEMRQEIRSLHDLFAAQTRTIVVTSFGSALTVATLVFIAAQIV